MLRLATIEPGNFQLIEVKMDYLNERHFVQAFIRKDRRDRLLYELTTPEKRYDGVSR